MDASINGSVKNFKAQKNKKAPGSEPKACKSRNNAAKAKERRLGGLLTSDL